MILLKHECDDVTYVKMSVYYQLLAGLTDQRLLATNLEIPDLTPNRIIKLK